MSAVIKRKLRETWRNAVAGRFAEAAPELADEGLALFDRGVAEGQGETEAAFAALSAYGLLWLVEGAGFTPPAEPRDSHSVPSL